ncbi:MAG: hypothetical protein Q8J71_10405 [Brevundimonas sp.]|jgi:hypothetical protein|nr:hypothetical protein [Brevundimonas sp.]
MTALDYVSVVLAETPFWAFAVLALLVFLGIRRLKPRVRNVGIALVAPVAFLIWGLFNVAAYSQAHSPIVGGATLIVLFAAGWASARLYSGETSEPVGDGQFLFHGTPEPLITYMTVFVIRFGLEVWQGFVPTAAALAGGLAIGVTAFAAGRTAQRAFLLVHARRQAVVTG